MMNININLIPKEFQPKPLIATKTLVLIVLVAALGYGCFYFYQLKSDSEAEAASIESRIQAAQEEALSLSSNPDAKALIDSINEVKAEKALLETLIEDYDVFVEAKIMWGDIVQRISSRVPTGVTIDTISQGLGKTVEVGGTAASYERAAAYATSLENDEAFESVPTRQWVEETSRFLLTVIIAAGGDR